MYRIAVAVAAVSLLACGSLEPKTGDACSPEGSLACESETMGLECKDGALRSISCRGPGGCVQQDNQVTCDPSQAVLGDGCAAAQESLGQCNASDPDTALKCTNGTWEAVPCNECHVEGGSVLCAK